MLKKGKKKGKKAIKVTSFNDVSRMQAEVAAAQYRFNEQMQGSDRMAYDSKKSDSHAGRIDDARS